jgi:hypothetical protein
MAKMPIVPPKVCVLTPTDQTTKGLVAFAKKFKAGEVDLQWFEAKGDHLDLISQAGNALKANPEVLVAAGSVAAGILQYGTITVPIVQGLGGEIPPNRKNNLTGFYSDAAKVAQYHLDNIKANEVTVLYDDKNDVSNKAYSSLVAGNKKPYPLPISDHNVFGKTHPDKEGFMVIPNAMYYEYAQQVVDMVDDNDAVKAVYYPEHEFRDLHKKNKNKAKVHGHHVEKTYERAAELVTKILKGTYTVNSLPDFAEAEVEKDV